MFPPLWRTFSARKTGRTRPGSNLFRPGVECLEDRLTPSCTASLSGDTLNIIGTNGGDVVGISENDDAGIIRVTCLGGLSGNGAVVDAETQEFSLVDGSPFKVN